MKNSIKTTDQSKWRWECMTQKAAFAPRDGAGLLSFQNKCWLLGGWNPSDKTHFPMVCNSEVWATENGRDWELVLLNAPWEGRHTAGYAVHDGYMWIIGGDCIQRRYQPDVWRSKNGIDWELVTKKAPWGMRVLHHTVAFDNKLWVMGGQTLPGFIPSETKTVFYHDVWCSTDGKNWTCVTQQADWPPRGMIGGAAVMNGAMWLIGGGTYETPHYPNREYRNDVWRSSDGIHWECVTIDGGWAPRQYHEVAAFDQRLWVLEGAYYRDPSYLAAEPDQRRWLPKYSTNRNDAWYSTDGATWYELPDTPWLPRHAASVTVHNDELWVVSGNNMTSDAWKLVRI